MKIIVPALAATLLCAGAAQADWLSRSTNTGRWQHDGCVDSHCTSGDYTYVARSSLGPGYA